MANEWHVNWLKEGVANWNYRRKRVKFAPDLSGIRFFDLLPPDFRDAPKTSRFFERIDLSGSNLSAADLSDLNFAGAKFDGANMIEANLSLSNFSGASFRGSKLLGAHANRSLFDKARFENADITGVDFSSSSAQGAVFIAVELTAIQT
ncbi:MULTISPECIES: pentapeptide repeat-containing protein [unclassified Ruegeria]|uniref:pentapeptide repeat-containing protein n=1 Tax=unclassified Ruegeria TaxID=2625375 RepID=UPI001AE4EDAC|nr:MULTISPECIES: pentapeptide repeat-containing protein [unclassified Ruegeria]